MLKEYPMALAVLREHVSKVPHFSFGHTFLLNAEVDQRCDEQDDADPPEHANLLLIRRCATAVEHELWPHERDQADNCRYGDIDMRHLSLLARTYVPA